MLSFDITFMSTLGKRQKRVHFVALLKCTEMVQLNKENIPRYQLITEERRNKSILAKKQKYINDVLLD